MIREPRQRVTRTLAMLLAVCAVALSACSKTDPVRPLPNQAVVPDFSLKDVNPNSPTGGQNVSPRQELGKVSAWYFGHAT